MSLWQNKNRISKAKKKSKTKYINKEKTNTYTLNIK